jgi:hypothetical protein
MTYEADSALVTRREDGLGYRSGAYGERREYAATISHIVGSGVLERYLDGWRPAWAGLGPDSTILDVAVALYIGVMEAGPHYLVHEGEVVQLCPERLAAWHCGSEDAEQYRRPDWARGAYYQGEPVDVRWWPQSWGLRSPLDLAGGALWGRDGELSANDGSVGIEILWPHDEARAAPSARTWQTWAELVRDVHRRRAIKLNTHRVVSHSDAHPAARSSGGEPWDPPPDLWHPVRVAQRLGIPPMTPAEP